MNTGTIISIAIVVLSILILIVVSLMTYKKAQPTIKNINDLNAAMNQKANYYTRESQHINDEITQLSNRVDGIQKDAEEKMKHLEDFTDEQGQFQTSIRYLQSHAGEYSKGIATNIKDEIQEDGPKVIEVLKRSFKKTTQKQKSRYKK